MWVAHVESCRWALFPTHQNKQSECKRALHLRTCSLNEPQWSLNAKSQLWFYNHYSSNQCLSESAGHMKSVRVRPELTAASLRKQSEHAIRDGGGGGCPVWVFMPTSCHPQEDWLNWSNWEWQNWSNINLVCQTLPPLFIYVFENIWFHQSRYILVHHSVFCVSLSVIRALQFYWLSHRTLA